MKLCTRLWPVYLGLSLGMLANNLSLALAVEISTPQHTQLAHTTPASDDTQINLPFNRLQWPLSEREWGRYLSLMQGIRGSVSPKTLSPLEVLGIHAETEQERKKYAGLWAKLMHEDVERTLAFQRAYSEAMLALYGKEDLFNGHLLTSATRQVASATVSNLQTTLDDGDRLLVFVKVKACSACALLAQKVLSASAHKKIQVDFYFIDTHREQDNPLLIAWAKQQQLDPQRLLQKSITLNHDQGTLFKVSQQLIAELPIVYRVRNNQLQLWSG